MLKRSLLTWLISLPLAYPVQANIDPDALATLQQAKTGEAVDQQPLAEAWQTVAAAELGDLAQLLSAFEGATPLGENWLSLAVDRVLERAAANGEDIPLPMLVSFIGDPGNGGRARETALELLREQDTELAARTVNQLIEDPVARLRRPAVEALWQRAEGEEDEEAKRKLLRRMFEVALDEDHIIRSAVALRELGEPQDHIRKFGFLMHWQVIGPFDYKDGEGFEEAYAPESLDLGNYEGDQGIYADAQHDGKDGPVAWQAYVNTARNGVVDLNKAIEELRDVVAYGATVYESPQEQPVQLRLRQQNAAKLWLNGELVFSQPVGHTGNFFDQYTIPVTLRKGPNLIVVKSCQMAGPVEHPFVKAWQFCVRVTDETGNAILAQNRPPTPELDPLPTAKDEPAAEEEPETEEKTS